MKALILSAALLPLTATVSLAAIENDLAKCAAISGDLERLQCFDDLAQAAGLDGPQPVAVHTGDTGKWRVSQETNPIDDTHRVVLALVATEGKSRWGGDIVFIARCRSNETEAYISWGDYLGNDGDIYNEWKRVTVRVGGEKAREERWSLSTDSQATFAPTWAGNLLKQMASTTKFIAQVTPYNESPRTAIFDTTGMASALKPLAETCGWEL
jgi:type VI secretion system protein VasI